MKPAPLSEIRLVPVTQVKPYPGNPRKTPRKAIEQTAASIREFGWQQPLVLDQDMVILAGHTRYEAALFLGEKQVPVTVAAQLTPEQARAFRIADNRSHDYTSWDFQQLLQELEGLDEDFSGILDLADWRTILGDYETGLTESELSPGGDTERQLSSYGQHNLTVTFDSQENADKAMPGILNIPGVINVAQSRR